MMQNDMNFGVLQAFGELGKSARNQPVVDKYPPRKTDGSACFSRKLWGHAIGFTKSSLVDLLPISAEGQVALQSN